MDSFKTFAAKNSRECFHCAVQRAGKMMDNTDRNGLVALTGAKMLLHKYCRFHWDSWPLRNCLCDNLFCLVYQPNFVVDLKIHSCSCYSLALNESFRRPRMKNNLLQERGWTPISHCDHHWIASEKNHKILVIFSHTVSIIFRYCKADFEPLIVEYFTAFVLGLGQISFLLRIHP